MTTIKTLPWGISPAKHSSGKIILDGCCFDDTKHPIFHDKFRDIQKYCLPDTIGVDTEFVYSIVCHCSGEDDAPAHRGQAAHEADPPRTPARREADQDRGCKRDGEQEPGKHLSHHPF